MECSPSLRSECMVLPYHKGLIIKKHFYHFYLFIVGLFLLSYISELDLQEVVSEHFLGQKNGIFIFIFCRISGAASL